MIIRKQLVLPGALIFAGWITSTTAFAAPPSLVMTPLGNFGSSPIGASYSASTGVNNSGQVVGFSNLDGSIFSRRSFLWTQGRLTANAGTIQINNSGQSIGDSSQIFNGNPYGCGASYANGTETFIPTVGIGPLPNALTNVMSQALAINDAGQVGGWAWNYDFNFPSPSIPPRSPIIWQNGQTTVITPTSNLLSNFNGGYAAKINNAGDAVGYYIYAGSGYYSFVWKNGTFYPLNNPFVSPDLVIGPATGDEVLNSHGDVAGYSRNSAWIWHDGQFTFIPSIQFTSDFNDSNWIVGYARKATAPSGQVLSAVAALWHDGITEEVATPPGYSIAALTKINAAGQSMGAATRKNSNEQLVASTAIFYDHGLTFYLDDPFPSSDGKSINTPLFLTDDGSIIGSYNIYSGTAFLKTQFYLWHNGDGMIPLENLVLGGFDQNHWDHILSLTDISDNGRWITGTGLTTAGNTEAFLIQLVPEPTTLALLALGALPLLRRTRRR